MTKKMWELPTTVAEKLPTNYEEGCKILEAADQAYFRGKPDFSLYHDSFDGHNKLCISYCNCDFVAFYSDGRVEIFDIFYDEDYQESVKIINQIMVEFGKLVRKGSDWFFRMKETGEDIPFDPESGEESIVIQTGKKYPPRVDPFLREVPEFPTSYREACEMLEEMEKVVFTNYSKAEMFRSYRQEDFLIFNQGKETICLSPNGDIEMSASGEGAMEAINQVTKEIGKVVIKEGRWFYQFHDGDKEIPFKNHPEYPKLTINRLSAFA